MNRLRNFELDRLVQALSARKARLLEEIRAGLVRSGDERHVRLAGEVADTGDESLADVLGEVSHAEVARDVMEVRDIIAAEARIAAGRYGVCIGCEADIGHERLAAYPSAKRCLRCQQIYEKTRAAANRASR